MDDFKDWEWTWVDNNGKARHGSEPPTTEGLDTEGTVMTESEARFYFSKHFFLKKGQKFSRKDYPWNLDYRT